MGRVFIIAPFGLRCKVYFWNLLLDKIHAQGIKSFSEWINFFSRELTYFRSDDVKGPGDHSNARTAQIWQVRSIGAELDMEAT